MREALTFAVTALPAYLAARAFTSPFRRPFARAPGARDVTIASTDGVTLGAWLFDAGVTAPRGTVVLAHGFRQDRTQLAHLAPLFAPHGLRTLAFDFRAHGTSKGELVTIGPHEARDIAPVLAYARALGGTVSFVGTSMGAAAYVLSGVEADRAVIDSPYDSLLTAVLARTDHMGVPRKLTGALLHFGTRRIGCRVDSVRPVDHVAALAHPTMLAYSAGDQWTDASGREAFRTRMPPGSAYFETPDGIHHDHFGEAWSSRVVAFVTGVTGAPT